MPAYWCAWNYKNNQETYAVDEVKPHITTMFSIHTAWRRNAMAIDAVDMTMSPHPTYGRKKSNLRRTGGDG